MKEGDMFVHPDLKIGTCSWNYDSWVGLVYTKPARTAAAYLEEYSRVFRTAEIDSWFYAIPRRSQVESYRAAVPEDFRFTCKVTRSITRPVIDGKPNETFLSHDVMEEFLDSIEPLIPRLYAVMFEFEYLNKQKMPSLEAFIDRFGSFATMLPGGIPYAVETRNGNYLKTGYFEFLSEAGLMHVFSDKQYMPPIYEVFDRFSGTFEAGTVIRLLGGDRKKIEDETGEDWSRIVSPRDDLDMVVDMIRKLKEITSVTVNVNNHYEGSAPLTIDRLSRLYEARSSG